MYQPQWKKKQIKITTKSAQTQNELMNCMFLQKTNSISKTVTKRGEKTDKNKYLELVK